MKDESSTQQKRQAFRTELAPQCVIDLALWPSGHIHPDDTITPSQLGEPAIQLDASRSYSLLVSNLSAGGMSLHMHNKRLTAKRISAWNNKDFIIKLKLATPSGEPPLTLLFFAHVIRATGLDGAAQLAIKFIARARFIRSSDTLQFFPVKEKGVDRLASWIARYNVNGISTCQQEARWVADLV